MGVLSGPPAALRQFAPALVLAIVAAQACVALDTPLPWMIGPLFATALACMAGARLAAPVQAREAGQWAIGSALGLYFSAPVLAVLARNLGWIALAVAFAILLGMAAGALLRRLAEVDEATAFFAMAVGGASEMAVQGERHGAAVERVAAAHSLRIMMVVGTIPFAVRWLSGHGWGQGHDPFAPLAVTLMLTAAGVELSRLPEWMIRAGQLFIGISLGTRFTPGFVRTAPRYLGGVMACTLLTMLLAGLFAFLVAMAAGLHPGTMILAASPGGIAEMSLTARVLHLGVPVVTAFHVSRMVVVVLAIGPLYRLWSRLG